MVLSSTISLGVRYHSVKLSAKSFTPGTFQALRSRSRAYSGLLQQSRHSPRLLVTPVGVPSSRNFWWGGSASKTTSSNPQTPLQASTPAPEPVQEAASTSAATPPSVDVLPTTPIDAAASVDPSIVPDPSILSGVADAVTAHAPVLYQWGDMAAQGLTNWTPAGLVRLSMEYIHLGVGLPWFWTIVAGTAAWRLVLFPFLLKGMRVSAAILPIQGKLSELQGKVSQAYQTKNTLELQKASAEMKQVYKDAGISPLSPLIALVQIPVTFGVFLGVQKMCTLPIESLKWSGLALLPDLTIADPTYILPTALVTIIQFQIWLGIRDIDTQTRPDVGHVMNVLRILTIPGWFVMSQFSTGLLVSLLTTSFLTTAQSALLRLPSFRTAMRIPQVPKGTEGSLPSFASTFRRAKEFIKDPLSDSMKQKVEAARREQMAQKRRS